MKKLILLLFFYSAAGCGEPKHITFRPDDHAATSGTLGSVKATNQLPEKSMDTVKHDKKGIPKSDSTRRND